MLKLRVLDFYFFTEINVFVITKRVKYRKKVPLGTGTEFQVPIPVLVPVQMWTVPNPSNDYPLNHSAPVLPSLQFSCYFNTVAAGCFSCPRVEATSITWYLAPEMQILPGNPIKKKLYFTPPERDF